MSIDLEKNSVSKVIAELHKLENRKKRWLSPSDIEEEYGFSKSTQSKMRMQSSSSTIPFSKIGKYIRYDRVAIDKWLEKHQVQGV